MGRDPKERVGEDGQSDGIVSHGEVVRGRPGSGRGWLAAVAVAGPVAVVAWLLSGAADGTADVAGFVLAEPAASGYELAAAFDDTDDAVVDEAGSPPVQALAPADSEDPWAEAFLLFRSDGTRQALLRGEVVDARGVEAFLDTTGAANSVRWEQGGEVFTVRSARLNREELIQAAAEVAAAENVNAVPGYDLLHEGPIRDFATRPVLGYGDIPGAAGVVYDRLDRPASVLITWGPAAEVLPWAPTVISSSVSRMTIDGHEAVIVGPDPFSRLMTMSWMQDGQLVQLAVSEDFPEGLDGLVQVASRVEPIGEAAFTALLGAHGGSVQFHLRRSLPDASGSSDVQIARLRSEIDDGVFATVAIRGGRSGAYRLQLDTDVGAGRAVLGVGNLNVTTILAVDVPVADTPGLSVLAGLAPPGTTELTVTDSASRGPLAVVSQLETTKVAGTDQLLFVQAVSGSGDHHRLAVVVHHDGDRTEFRL